MKRSLVHRPVSLQLISLFRTPKRVGIADRDMQTSIFSISPRHAPYNRQNLESPYRIICYPVCNQVAVWVRDLADLRRQIDAMAGAGTNRINGMSLYGDKAESVPVAANEQMLCAKFSVI